MTTPNPIIDFSKPPPFLCFACGDGNTGLYCLGCAEKMLKPNPTTDWIDAAKSKPEDCRAVIVHIPTDWKPVTVGYYDTISHSWRRCVIGSRAKAKVTHWRDFPEPPK